MVLGRTSMPGAGQTAVCGQNSIDQRSSIVGALCTDSLDLAAIIEEEDLGVEAFNFDLLLGAWLEVERGDALELVLLGHGFWGCSTEVGTGRWYSDDGLCNVVVEQGLDNSVKGDWSGPEDDGIHEA